MIRNIVVSVISLVLVIGVVVGIIGTSFNKDDQSHHAEDISEKRKAVTQFCAPTEFQDKCIDALNHANTNDPKELLKTSIIRTQEAVQILSNLSDSLIVEAINNKDNSSRIDLEDCKDILQFAIDDLHASFLTVDGNQLHTLHIHSDDIMAKLNAVITYQQTCLDEFEGENNPFKQKMEQATIHSAELTSNALAIVDDLSRILESFGIRPLPINDSQPIKKRRLLQVGNDGYPSWFSAADRKLLSQNEWTPNAVVAKDGSGQYKTIQEALDAYPMDLQGRYVIHIKAGIYKEHITMGKHQKNVFMYGDGMSKTIVTNYKNFQFDGYSTVKTATFSAVGEGFIAKHMGFSNTAGPNGLQAVALRVQADRAAIFDCRIDGYQDTLYTHAYRQFYRNCVISGTIDFIFGDATAIIQNSWIVVRRPSPNQVNTVTSQSRAKNSQTTSLVLQNCRIVPDEKLWHDRWKIPTYLGRPWKEYATTVFLENTFADFIQPDGYIPFQGKENNTKTCTYYEYNNRGPGARNEKRVPWPGVQLIDRHAAEKFTVLANLQGDKWLKDAHIPYDLGLAPE